MLNAVETLFKNDVCFGLVLFLAGLESPSLCRRRRRGLCATFGAGHLNKIELVYERFEISFLLPT